MAEEQQLKIDALEYHRLPTPGKISVTPTKALANQRDLSLAYSPGVADACMAIEENPHEAANLTARGNLVAVITNGTAVLGLGNIGALAGKPVMEGKGCLFKKFAGIDVFDIELARNRPRQADRDRRRARADLRRHQPRGHQGARVLLHREEAARAHEDPGLPRRPARHGDRRGRGDPERRCKIVGKDIAKVKLACSGAGAAALACLDLLVSLGLKPREHPRHRRQGRGLQGPQGGHGPEQGALRAGTRARGRWPTSSPAPTSSSACRPAACSSRRWSRRWPTSRSSWRWPIPSRRSGPRSRRRCGPTA